MGRASKDKRDIYYRKAKEEGYRARSAYKLLQIHEDFNILNAQDITTGAVDLCAAPGSWCQVLSNHFKRIEAERKASSATHHEANSDSAGGASAQKGEGPLKPRIVAVDLQEMAPVDGVRILQGDITSEATAREIVHLLNTDDDDDDRNGGESAKQMSNEEADTHGESSAAPASSSPSSSSSSSSNLRKADIVVCDGAPDVTGMHELDEYLQHHLLLAALNITTFVLRPGGTFVTKMFRGPNTAFLVAKSELFFDQVRVVKPKSSRNASMECFLLCQNFRLPEGYSPHFTSVTGSGAATVAEDAPSTSPPSPPPPTTTTTTSEKLEVEGGAQLTCDAPHYTYRDPHTPHANQQHHHHLSQMEHTLLPFLSCGDLSGFDADMCYDRPRGHDVLAPVQPPLQAPYLTQPTHTTNTSTAPSAAIVGGGSVPDTKKARME